MKYSFKNDYGRGCHPQILNALSVSNMEIEEGYGEDRFSKAAKELIKAEVGGDPEVYFVAGGTQANLTVISALLKPYESVISANTAHIQVHETGAIEATGHRIQTIDTPDGKLRPEDIQGLLTLFEEVHTTIPRLVYISNSTEVGTIYSKQELMALYECCRAAGLLLFMDGARLSSALASKENDLSFLDLGKYTDVFYIGGTKAGALLGEAIVFNNKNISTGFAYNMKQKGALMAKGRILGIQFLELFRDGLFLKLAAHANEMAQQLKFAIKGMGIDLICDTSTNQIFPVLNNRVVEALKKDYEFIVWQKIDAEHSAIRLVTCWATEEEAVKQFLEDLSSLKSPSN
ncbi:aminotransferase class V-fold PLP-dependent enzyme [Pedobacter sp. MC2016-14]|uniref:threonine aldolase family protein n=1 Tax=Pedobacter sp. MC2016-14 TaxID=2897327 RepID=UPI001E4AFE21|nr:aminotransferase class V-fold PLP-dependent enzyme [Pedobacter sp. MC2016-14]MCD0487609.1 aminotransferase class V-fold PLP-dependent enzyme [Pedobacter sp. MC2016-14]